MVEALARVAAVFRKRLPSTEDPDDATAAAPSKRAKLDHDDRGCTGPALAAAPAETRVGPTLDDTDAGVGVRAAAAADGPQQEPDEEPRGRQGPDGVAEGGDDDGVALRSLLELECPVCVDTMQPPVRQCVNGHCVCNACRARVSACPLCRGPLTGGAHPGLDGLARALRALTLPCAHRTRGCPLRLKVAERDNHLLECAFNASACPLRTCTACPWEGVFAGVRGHCLDQHPERTQRADLGTPASFSVEAGKDSLLVLLADTEVFLLEVRAAPRGRLQVLARQVAAGRLRPPAFVCSVALRSKAMAAVGARAPVVAADEPRSGAAGRCLLVAAEVAAALCADDGGFSLECTLAAAEAHGAGPGWLAWLAGKVWPAWLWRR